MGGRQKSYIKLEGHNKARVENDKKSPNMHENDEVGKKFLKWWGGGHYKMLLWVKKIKLQLLQIITKMQITIKHK